MFDRIRAGGAQGEATIAFDWISLLLLTLLAVVTRVYGIWEWSYDGDEYTTVVNASERARSLINPAYYQLELGSFALFGISEWSARLPATILGIASIPLFYWQWRNVVGRHAALLGGLLIVASSWHLWYSQFARFYSGVFLFASLAWYHWYRAVTLDSVRQLVIALICMLAGCLFHATFVMVPVSCALFALLTRFGAVDSSAYSRRIAAIYLMTGIVACLAVSPFFLKLLTGRAGSDAAAWGDLPAEMVLQIVRRVQIPVAVAALLGLLLLARTERGKALYFAIGIALPAAFVLVTATILNSRAVYMFYALPLIIALAAYLCEQCRRVMVDRGAAAYAVLIIVLASMGPEFVSHYAGRASLNLGDVARCIEDNHQPGDAVASTVNELNLYLSKDYAKVWNPGNPNVGSDWVQGLTELDSTSGRLWIVVDFWRKPITGSLSQWLDTNASLVYTKTETRIDYTVRGYSAFLRSDAARASVRCK